MAATGLTELAPAKVNLTLRVTGRRDDGYHLLDSVVVFTDFGDRLSLTPHDLAADRLTLGGIFGAALARAPAADNLVLRALGGFRRRLAPMPMMQAHLDKNLPIAAGIGGGSSDAAACLRLLARRAGIALDDPRLTALAADLGADVPVCLRGRSARVTGIGEDIEDLPAWPGLGIVLINPGRGLATPRVFAARGGDFRAPDPTARTVATAAGAAAFVRAGDNDLRLAAARLAPEIDAVLSLLKTAKARLAEGLSGSGATCFALFADIAAAHRQAALWQRQKPRWWIRAGWAGGA